MMCFRAGVRWSSEVASVTVKPLQTVLRGIRFPARAAAILAVMAGAAVTWTAVGWGQPVPGIDLRWSAPARCPSAANVRERIRHLLGGVAESHSEHIVADVDVVEVGGRYQLTLNLRSNGSRLGKSRSLESESCDSLAGAAAVTVAMLVRSDSPASTASSSTPGGPTAPRSAEPHAAASSSAPTASAANAASPRSEREAASAPQGPTSGTSSPPQSAPPHADVTVARTAPDAVTATAPSRQQEGSWHPLIHAPVLGIDGSVLPSWSYGFGVGLGIRRGLFDIVLDGRFSLPQSASLGDYASSFDRRGATVTGCYEWRSGPIGVAPCFSLLVDDVTARGAGPYVTSSSDDVAWVSAGLAIRARWSLGAHAALFVSPGLVLAASRPTFVINGFGQVYQVPLTAFATSFGCEWIL